MYSRMWWIIGPFLLLTLTACGPRPTKTRGPSAISLQAFLGSKSDARGFARAVGPRTWHFPADQGPHVHYRTEWWYYTGTLQTRKGRDFGFELTFFRFGLAPEKVARDSPWRSREIYMADFAVTDPQGQHFTPYERFSRQALGLAGAQAQPFKVWLENWSVAAGRHGFPWQLKAREGQSSVSLALSPVQGVVLNGIKGLSRKGPLAGDASYYYSMPRLAARGTLIAQGHPFKVSGQVWMDHEWSTSALTAHQVGWDWFGLRLQGGGDLMLYQLRDRQGRKDPFSAGTWVSPKGKVIHLSADDFRAIPQAYWSGPHGGRYPVAWVLTVPSRGLYLKVHARLDNQLLPFAIRYWEGMVSVTGEQRGHPVQGEGYLELTGY